MPRSNATEVMRTSGPNRTTTVILEHRGRLFAVHTFEIPATGIIHAEALEPLSSSRFIDAAGGSHGTITHGSDLGGQPGWWGTIHTRRLPARLNALPARTERRSAAVRNWYRRLEQLEAAIIRAAGKE